MAAVGIASLGLGIAANVTIYSVVREMILDDLSATKPDRLARAAGEVTYANYRDLRHAGVFQDLAFDAGLGNINWDLGSHGEVAWQMPTSANFFEVLGVGASAGRLYAQSDEGRPVAVVSYGFWLKRLHADPNALGRPLQLNERLYTLLGVLPRDYRSILGHGVSPEIYRIASPDSRRCHLFGRLRDGWTREQTRQAFAATARVLLGQEPDHRIDRLRPMSGLAAKASGEGDDRRFFIFFVMLFGTSVLLGAIACLNVAGLLLSRGVTRQRELAIRKALGANRWQMARQLLAEGLLLVLLGAAAGSW